MKRLIWIFIMIFLIGCGNGKDGSNGVDGKDGMG